MSVPLFRRSARWLLVCLVVTLTGCIAIRFWTVQRDKARLAKLISRVHLLSKDLETYVSDKGSFPDSLETMVREMHLDERVLTPLYGEKMEYIRPIPNAPGTSAVLVVTVGTHEIIVNKDFERKQKQ